ncbi:MAG: Various polyols ABC transporter, substrate-binding protein, partial [uncultured Thermomicrobiales bacterium]
GPHAVAPQAGQEHRPGRHRLLVRRSADLGAPDDARRLDLRLRGGGRALPRRQDQRAVPRPARLRRGDRDDPTVPGADRDRGRLRGQPLREHPREAGPRLDRADRPVRPDPDRRRLDRRVRGQRVGRSPADLLRRPDPRRPRPQPPGLLPDPARVVRHLERAGLRPPLRQLLRAALLQPGDARRGRDAAAAGDLAGPQGRLRAGADQRPAVRLHPPVPPRGDAVGRLLHADGLGLRRLAAQGGLHPQPELARVAGRAPVPAGPRRDHAAGRGRARPRRDRPGAGPGPGRDDHRVERELGDPDQPRVVDDRRHDPGGRRARRADRAAAAGAGRVLAGDQQPGVGREAEGRLPLHPVDHVRGQRRRLHPERRRLGPPGAVPGPDPAAAVPLLRAARPELERVRQPGLPAALPRVAADLRDHRPGRQRDAARQHVDPGRREPDRGSDDRDPRRGRLLRRQAEAPV